MLWERDRTEVIYRISGLTGISDPEQLDEEAVRPTRYASYLALLDELRADATY